MSIVWRLEPWKASSNAVAYMAFPYCSLLHNLQNLPHVW